ncbi:MAG: putative periplasmic or secreted lipoprotein [Candidatus Angelobacter sp.]|nr:putative periplasmic or secreted lipoprotein [Candidatus Angelobacter sp.]
MKRNLSVVLIAIALLAAGCSRIGSRTDAQVASDVQNKINGDGSIPDKQLNINANNGVVTLTGTVASDAARNAAANDAAQIEGVKTVVNNLEVASASAANQTTQPQDQANYNPPPPAREERRPSPSARYRSPRPSSSRSANNNGGDTGLRTTVPAGSGNTNSYDSAQSSAPPAPTPVPLPQKITVPSGTQLSIRLNDEVDSEKAQVGDVFHGSLSAPVSIGDETVIPTTADVEGRVVDVKSAGRFAGQSVLTLELTKLTMNGKAYSLQTSQWTKSGNGRGKSTAAKVGGGAAVGAVLGGIFGGGKGAAIGAAAGAGAGTGVSAATKGQQIILKPEAIIAFQLQGPITVTPGASRSAMNQ